MPSLKSIKSKISSIKNTRQITKAMKMVAGSRLKRNQSAMNELRPYAQSFEEVVTAISRNTVLHFHPFFGTQSNGGKNYSEGGGGQDSKDMGIVLLSTDRGLCGAFNINLFKLVHENLNSVQGWSGRTKFYVIGKKGADFIKKEGLTAPFVKFFSEYSDIKSLSSELSAAIIDDFLSGRISGVSIACNQYISTIKQNPVITRLLPFAVSPEKQGIIIAGGYLIDPVIKEDEILDALFKKYIRSTLMYKITESQAAEQAARMNAMDNATRNAGNLINKLTVSYNKARQAAVTLEILDIINGVNAVS